MVCAEAEETVPTCSLPPEASVSEIRVLSAMGTGGCEPGREQR